MVEIVSLEKIWDHAPHSAFTDLLRVDDGWLCTFREAEAHDIKPSTIRVLRSDDGEQWSSIAEIIEPNVDLRDPKLSVMPDGRLMLLMGGSTYTDEGRYLTRSPRVSFSDSGNVWTPPTRVLAEDHWLWRVTWHGNMGYAVSKLGEGSHPRRGFLYRTRDGLEWEWITEFFLPKNTWTASETTLRIMPNDEMVALIRPDWIGTSDPPYTDWRFTQIKHALGGPNFIRLPDGALWASGRVRNADGQPETVLARMTPTTFEPVFSLPSGGDNSYAGMVWHDNLLWMSYYSSHEGKTSIYLARLKLGG
jgi:hypothetical protein